MQSLISILVPRIAWLYLHFVALTSTIRWTRREREYALAKKQGRFIFAFWHGRQVFLPYAYRNYQYNTIVSQSKDGELIARVIHLFGMGTVRGSSSRGGLRALVELVRVLESGRGVAFTPDGPRGPKRTVAPGVLYTAQKSGKSILPVTYSARYKIIFRGWDDFWVPLPFNRIEVGLGRAVSVGPGDDIEAKSAELARELNALTDGADRRTAVSGWGDALAFALYTSLFLLASPLIVAGIAARYPKTFFSHWKEGLAARFGRWDLQNLEGGPVWLHAASLGECRAALPLARKIKSEQPKRPIIVTCTTSAGVAEAKKLGLGDRVFYAPLDLPWIARGALERLKPELIVLLESELWPHLIREAHAAAIPIGVVNGRMSERSARRYGWVRAWTRRVAVRLDFVCAREEADARRYISIGAPEENVKVCGNLKFDLQPAARNGARGTELPGPVLAAGSVREGEQEAVLDGFQKLREFKPDAALVLAPRHFDRIDEWVALARKRGFSVARRSRGGGAADVLIWDTFGDLIEAYRNASVVYVGGSLVAKGGQNPIEPAWLGKPVIFGPHMENFAEPARMLVESGGAVSVRDAAELGEQLRRWFADPAQARGAGEKAQQAVQNLVGRATESTWAVLKEYLA